MSGLKMTTTDGKVFTPPTFSHKYLLKSVVEQNDQGSWFGWDISIVEQLSAEEAVIYAAAKQFSSNTNSGAVVSTKEKNADDLPF